MALGATRNSVYLTTLKEAFAPVGVGLGLGWIASVGIGKSVAALLYGTGSTNATLSITVILTFVLASIIATFLPCRRAAMLEPMEALRAE
jgi:ABC-type antimicrobial peptide transport system permease subunit